MTNNLRGALWILMAASCAAGMIICIKGLNGEVPTIQIVFVRCSVGVAIVLAFSMPTGGVRIRSPQWKLLFIRGLMSLVTLFCGFYVVSILPLTTATVLFFTAPLFVTILSVPFFGEQVGWRRGLATLAGFVGAVIVLRPDMGHVDATMLIALASSSIFAGVLLMGKKLSKTDDVSTLIIYAMGIAGIGSAPFAIAEWVPLSWAEWGLLLGVAGFGTLRNLSDTKGYDIGEASVMAPFQYTRIVIVAIAGYMLFSEVPDMATWIGAIVIMGSSLYIAQREAKLGRGIEGAPKPSSAAP
jgi:drug/metabolite transporter (DMT)-like permease